MFRHFISRMDAPVLLLLDDLHHADEGSLDFLNYLTQVNRDLPMLIVVMTRPTHFKWAAHVTSVVDMQLIKLEPLDKRSSRLLVNELLKQLPKIPTVLRELITNGAEGNPFYMEELVKMLVDEGALVTSANGWHVNPDKLLDAHVPPTLTGVLQARLDRLKPGERLALQQASVIGFVFWDQALQALNPMASAALPALVRNALAVLHQHCALEAGVEGVHEYAFSNQLMHQVTYGTLLKQNRRAYHAQVAKWLTSLSGVRARDFLGATAEHWVQAGDPVQGCEFFTRAAEDAATRYAHETATSYVSKALALAAAPLDGIQPAELHLLRWRLFDVRERTLDLLGKRSQQQADIDAMQELAEALDDDHCRAEVAWRRSDIAMRTGDFRAMQAAASQAVALAKGAGNALLRLRGQHRLAVAHCYLNQAADAQALAQDGLREARAMGARALEALFLNALSVIADSQPDRIASLEMDQQDLLINRELGNRRNEAIALGNLGQGWLRLGQHAQARRLLEESLRLARAISDHATQPNSLNNLSLLALRQGDDALALAHAQMALDIAIEVQNPDFEAISLCALGQAELALGRHPAAQSAFERAHSVALQRDCATQHDASAGLARVALAQNDVDAAMQALQGLLARLPVNAVLEGAEAPHLIRLTCYQVLAQAGDTRAPKLLALAHAELLVVAITISDTALRHSFLNNIPEHRAIMAAKAADPTGRA
jgi:predicted ATPase